MKQTDFTGGRNKEIHKRKKKRKKRRKRKDPTKRN